MICGATSVCRKAERGIPCFNAARSMICGATTVTSAGWGSMSSFNAARSMICGATRKSCLFPRRCAAFQCRTQHDMWCNSVAHSPCPTQGERAFWKVVDFFTVFPLWGGIFTEKSRCQSTHSLVRRGAAPKWKMATVECGFAASPSHFPLFCTFYIISNTMEFFKHNTYCAHSFFTSLGFGRTARLRKRLSFPSMLICAMFLSHSGC
mgnify:CR=1 FL=1